MDILLASSNEHKISEIRAILSDLNIRIFSLSDIGYHTEIEETGKTFLENALIKARALQGVTNMAILADDSGLEVFSLNNAPGVHSARFKEDHNDIANDLYLISLLKDKPKEARFTTTLVFLKTDGTYEAFNGYLYGEIIANFRGKNGFGYDPIFLLPEMGKTLAELTPEEKNSLSHRFRAVMKFKEYYENTYLK